MSRVLVAVLRLFREKASGLSKLLQLWVRVALGVDALTAALATWVMLPWGFGGGFR